MTDLRKAAEPVAWMWKDGSLTSDPDEADGTWIKLYTAPPKREWVGLTDEELDQAMEYWSDPSRSAFGGAYTADNELLGMQDTWRYIEAKLKEKNT